MDSTRVAVFIDNSNTLHNIQETRAIDPNWVSLYDPLQLAQKLVGNRKLEYVGFYCVQPPAYLLSEGARGVERYATTRKYYSAIEKLPSVEVKYGDLKGSKGALIEKNVDTQISADMVAMAALNRYDTAILVSSDGDYVSAVEHTKEFHKKVELVFFRGKISMALKRACDVRRRARRSHFRRLTLT